MSDTISVGCLLPAKDSSLLLTSQKRRGATEGPREPSKVFQKNPLTNRLVEIFLTSVSRQSIENYMNLCLANKITILRYSRTLGCAEVR